jgi:uncharacterized protein YkwD
MKFRVLLVLVLSSINFCNAQIDGSNLNRKLLEHEIKMLVDSTRLAHNLAPLFNDSILYVASDHHAKYLVAKGALSHQEVEKKEFYNPQDRANYYGAPKSYLVGENLVYTHYNNRVKVKGKTFITDNYKAIARSLVFSWINSKGHFKNMITPEYQVTGLSIGVDTVKQRIYACQKFAHVIYKYSFKENTTFFPYSKMSQDAVNSLLANAPKDLSYPFGLRYDEKEKCEECKESWRYYPPFSVRIARKYFILRIEDAEFVKQLIKNRRDGFAVEMVPFDAYACGNSAYETEASRRNGMKRTSGHVLEPVYRNDLMKGFRKRKRVKDLSFAKYLFTADSVSFFKRFGRYKLVNFKAKYFEIKLGKVPKDMNGWWNHNLMYIHNKQICHFKYLTNYPGELVTELINVPYYPPVPVNDYEFILDQFKDTIELLYGPGETVTSGGALSTLIKKYKEKNVTIKSIRIDGFCSVEGDAATNEMLHRQRAENILEQLRSLMESDTVYRLHSQVAWDHFYASVKDAPKWKFLYPLSKSEIVSYLTDPKNERPLDILSEERKVKVEITGVRELNPKNANYYVKRDLVNLFYKDKRGKLQCKDENAVRRLYEKAYYFTTVDTLTVKNFLNIVVPRAEAFVSHPLDHDIAFYRYHYLKDSVDRLGLAKLESKVESVFTMCGAAEHLSPEFHYLSACFLVERIKRKKDNTVNNPDIQKAFDRLNLLLNWYDLDSTFRLDVAKANLNIVNILCETINPDQLFEYNDIVNKSLIHIVEYYRNTDQLNPQMVLSLSKLLCYFKNIPLAMSLCADYLDDNEVLKLYLPLAYNHSSYLSSDEEFEFETYYQNLLMEAKGRLTSEEWCNLFYGEYGIPFQVMDDKNLHSEFCSTCPDRVNDVLEVE